MSLAPTVDAARAPTAALRVNISLGRMEGSRTCDPDRARPIAAPDRRTHRCKEHYAWLPFPSGRLGRHHIDLLRGDRTVTTFVRGVDPGSFRDVGQGASAPLQLGSSCRCSPRGSSRERRTAPRKPGRNRNGAQANAAGPGLRHSVAMPLAPAGRSPHDRGSVHIRNPRGSLLVPGDADRDGDGSGSWSLSRPVGHDGKSAARPAGRGRAGPN
jgi:hypothetical protein